MERNIMMRRRDILLDLANASLEEVTQILDDYKASEQLDCGMVNMIPILIDGINYRFKYNPQEAASLNARYRELTGRDHSGFLVEQKKALDLMLSNKETLVREGYLSHQIDTLEKLRMNLMQEQPTIEVTNGVTKHILNRTTDILTNIQGSSFEDINALLNYYNGQPVIIDGIAHHPFNDPISASRLNERYFQLTGQNHPVFAEQVPKVIDGLMAEKDALIKLGAYSPNYFEYLEQIKQGLEVSKEEQPKQM